MKKFLIALAVLIFGASALQQAKGQEISVDYFYDNLSGGNWIDVEGYGYGWQPDIAVNDQNWRPYADGYWAYTDDGWTWISYEDFGWATYHYGRWANLADYGWIWFPGEDLDWGPAWVSWRTGGDYVGWAPLPPRGPGIVYEGRPIGPQVDIEFDIGPQYYNFCEIRYIGEPVLRNYIAPPVQNITYINNTVNVTNITVRNNVVYNYGPNYEVLSARSTRPIQRLNIERQSVTNLSAAAKSGALTKVQGNKLVVAAPPKFAKAVPSTKPPTVKAKVAQPKLNRGWAGVPSEAQLKQKIKTENPKNVPPPTGAAARKAVGSPPPELGASPAVPSAAGAAGVKGKPGRVPSGAKPTPPSRMPSSFQRAKQPGGPGGRPQSGATISPAGAPARTPVQSFRPSPPQPEHGQPPKSRLGETPRLPSGRSTIPDQGRNKAFGTEGGTTPPSAGRGAEERRQPGVRKPPTTPPAGEGQQGAAQVGRERSQGAYSQPAGGQPKREAPSAAKPGQAKPEGGKKKGEGTPPPRGQ